MTKKEVVLIGVVAIIALVGGQFVRYNLNPATNNPTTITSLPHFELPDTTGNIRHSHEWQDSILIINFWATWCASCREEIPLFIKLQSEYQAKNVQFIGIAVDDDAKLVNEYLKPLAINYPILIGGDKAMRLARYLDDTDQAIPYTIIVNAQGAIIHAQRGEFSQELFNKIVVPLL